VDDVFPSLRQLAAMLARHVRRTGQRCVSETETNDADEETLLRRRARETRKETAMADNRTVYHVVPNASAERWVVTIENNDAFREEYETKQEALDAAKNRARSAEPAQVKVHRKDGNMEYESTYGQDPRRSPG
jgi:hypothetical protein